MNTTPITYFLAGPGANSAAGQMPTAVMMTGAGRIQPDAFQVHHLLSGLATQTPQAGMRRMTHDILRSGGVMHHEESVFVGVDGHSFTVERACCGQSLEGAYPTWLKRPPSHYAATVGKLSAAAKRQAARVVNDDLAKKWGLLETLHRLNEGERGLANKFMKAVSELRGRLVGNDLLMFDSCVQGIAVEHPDGQLAFAKHLQWLAETDHGGDDEFGAVIRHTLLDLPTATFSKFRHRARGSDEGAYSMEGVHRVLMSLHTLRQLASEEVSLRVRDLFNERVDSDKEEFEYWFTLLITRLAEWVEEGYAVEHVLERGLLGKLTWYDWKLNKHENPVSYIRRVTNDTEVDALGVASDGKRVAFEVINAGSTILGGIRLMYRKGERCFRNPEVPNMSHSFTFPRRFRQLEVAMATGAIDHLVLDVSSYRELPSHEVEELGAYFPEGRLTIRWRTGLTTPRSEAKILWPLPTK